MLPIFLGLSNCRRSAVDLPLDLGHRLVYHFSYSVEANKLSRKELPGFSGHFVLLGGAEQPLALSGSNSKYQSREIKVAFVPEGKTVAAFIQPEAGFQIQPWDGSLRTLWGILPREAGFLNFHLAGVNLSKPFSASTPLNLWWADPTAQTDPFPVVPYEPTAAEIKKSPHLSKYKGQVLRYEVTAPIPREALGDTGGIGSAYGVKINQSFVRIQGELVVNPKTLRILYRNEFRHFVLDSTASYQGNSVALALSRRESRTLELLED